MTKNRTIKDIMKDIEKVYFQLGKLYGELDRLLKPKKKTKCIFSKGGICNSDYRKFRKCNGIKIPDDCPYHYKKMMEIKT